MKYLQIVLNSGYAVDVVTNAADTTDILYEFVDDGFPFFFFQNGVIAKEEIACLLIFDEAPTHSE